MRLCFLLLCFVIGFATGVNAQTGLVPTLKVSGEVTTPMNLTKAGLAKMSRTTVLLHDRNGKENYYTGVLLQTILAEAGVTMGRQLHGENLSKYLLVKCADGYQVLFSLAELDSAFTNHQVILADEMSGKPLPANEGPFRLIVPDDKRPARSSFQVVEMVVRFAKEE